MALPSSDRYRLVYAEAPRTVAALEVLRPGAPSLWAEVIDGSFNVDRTRPVRYSCSLELDPGVQLGGTGLTFRGVLVRLWCGVDYELDWSPLAPRRPGAELFPCGTYRVSTLRTNLPMDRVSLTGVGVEAFLVGDEFYLDSGYYPGGSAHDGLRRFIGESYPGQVSIDFRTADVPVGEAAWDARWGDDSAACQMLARTMGAEVYADALGGFVVRPTPGLQDSPTGEFTDDPQTGTLLKSDRAVSREGVKNMVVVSSSATLPDGIVLAPQLAWDRDPYSPTYMGQDPYGSPDPAGFGREVLRHSTPLAVTEDALLAVAESLLADSRGVASQTDASVLVDFTLEAGDVRIVTTDLGNERQLVDSFTCPVRGGQMDLGLRSTRIF